MQLNIFSDYKVELKKLKKFSIVTIYEALRHSHWELFHDTKTVERTFDEGMADVSIMARRGRLIHKLEPKLYGNFKTKKLSFTLDEIELVYLSLHKLEVHGRQDRGRQYNEVIKLINLVEPLIPDLKFLHARQMMIEDEMAKMLGY